MKTYIFGDSISAKRTENIGFTEFPYLLFDSKILINVSKPFQTSEVLRKQTGLSGRAFVNLGLVDCSERKFSRFEYKILSRLPDKLRKLIQQSLNREPCIKRCFVPLERYKANIESFVINNPDLKIFIVGILSGSPDSKLSLVTREQIKKYNYILRSISSLNNLEYICTKHINGKESYLLDGYHLNEYGHKQLKQLIEAKLETQSV